MRPRHIVGRADIGLDYGDERNMKREDGEDVYTRAEDHSCTDVQADDQHELVLPAPRRNDTTLVAAIRRGDEGALREFCERFRPLLLDRARRIGVRREDREHTVMDFLDDFALRLAMGEVSYTAPSFVVKAFRNQVVDRWRREQREHNTDHALNAISEFARRAASNSSLPSSGSINIHNDPLSAVDVMVRHLLSQCNDAERNLIVWASHGVPFRTIAEWLGISYSAARARWCRLRAKLHVAATAYVDTVTGRNRLEIERFLRYAGVLCPASAAKHGVVRGERHA
jgi:DNA-directed RNA polymerase specialized sigma24 family protein